MVVTVTMGGGCPVCTTDSCQEPERGQQAPIGPMQARACLQAPLVRLVVYSQQPAGAQLRQWQTRAWNNHPTAFAMVNYPTGVCGLCHCAESLARIKW